MEYYSQTLASLFRRVKPLTSIALTLVLLVQALGPGVFAIQIASAATTTIFEDGFENTPQFSNPLWQVADPQWQSNNSDPYAGSKKAQVKGNTVSPNHPENDQLKRSQSTVGYENIVFNYVYRADSLETGDTVKVEWSENGTTWNTLFTINNGYDDDVWHPKSHPLPATANNNPNFAIRFIANLDLGNDTIDIDSVSLVGDAQTGTLIVKKVIVGYNGPIEESDFSFSVNGGITTSFEVDGQNDIVVTPGTYTVTEESNPLTFVASYENCTDVTVSAGETETCVITNTYSDTPPLDTDATARIVATKIVCEDEALLPDWATGNGPTISATAAADFLASTPERTAGCEVQSGWNFQWGPDTAVDAGGLFVGPALAPWVTFGPTNGFGVAAVSVDASTVGDRIWIREELKNGFLGFSFDGDNDNTTSAEIYCHEDGLNYDNHDYILNPENGETYYCIAFNVENESEPIDNTCIEPIAPQNGDKITEFGLSFGGEISLQMVLDTEYGANYIHTVNDETGYEGWSIPLGTNSITLDGKFVRAIADNAQAFGYYFDGDLSTFTPIFKESGNAIAASVVNEGEAIPPVVIDTTGKTSIGFAINTVGIEYATKKSQNGGEDHAVVYNPESNKYIIAFEDLPFTPVEAGDEDYQDLVVEINITNCTEVEPCTPDSGTISSDAGTTVAKIELNSGSTTPNVAATVIDPADVHAVYGTGAWSATTTDANAKWIWAENLPVTNNEEDKYVTFSETFTVTGNPTEGSLQIAADNSYEVWINGVLTNPAQIIDSAENNHAVTDVHNVLPYLVQGSNTLTIRVKNWALPGEAANRNPGGLLYTLNWKSDCGGGTPNDPEELQVKIYKFLDGAQATASSSGSYNFPMQSMWNWPGNLGGSGTYTLGTTGHGGSGEYQAFTSVMTWPADYQTYEITSAIDPQSNVLPIGAACEAGKFRLVGYSYGTTYAEAVAASTTDSHPVFTNLDSDRFVIVRNETCPELPPDCIAGAQWADVVISSNQLKRKDGSNVLLSRSSTTSVIGAPDGSFMSLGFGGSIVIKFNTYIEDVSGNDLSFHEVTNGTYPAESAAVRVSQDGTTWYSVGTVTNVGGGVKYLDFSGTGLSWIQYVEITDTTDPSIHSADADGYDLDAIDATSGVCDEPEPEIPPQIAGVTMCKVDQNEEPLSGWTLALLGANVGSLSVPGTGATTSSAVLPAGNYVFEANGTYTYRVDAVASTSDAAYSYRLNTDSVYGGSYAPWVRVNDFPSPITGWLGVMVNGAFTDWGNIFNPAHRYFSGTTTSATSSIDFAIWDDNYGDNSGSIEVDIYNGFVGVTDGDGCVEFDEVSYGSYTAAEIDQDGWTNVSGLGLVEVNASTTVITIVNSDATSTPPTNNNNGGGGGGPTITTNSTPLGSSGGGSSGGFSLGATSGLSDPAPEILGAFDELPGLPNTGNSPLKTSSAEAFAVFATIALAILFANVAVLRSRTR